MNREKLENMVLNNSSIASQLKETETDLLYEEWNIPKDNGIFDFINHDKVWGVVTEKVKQRVKNEEETELINWLLEYYYIEEIKKECK